MSEPSQTSDPQQESSLDRFLNRQEQKDKKQLTRDRRATSVSKKIDGGYSWVERQLNAAGTECDNKTPTKTKSGFSQPNIVKEPSSPRVHEPHGYPNSPRNILNKNHAYPTRGGGGQVSKGQGGNGKGAGKGKGRNGNAGAVQEEVDFFKWRDLIRENTKSKKEDEYPEWDTDQLESDVDEEEESKDRFEETPPIPLSSPPDHDVLNYLDPEHRKHADSPQSMDYQHIVGGANDTTPKDDGVIHFDQNALREIGVDPYHSDQESELRMDSPTVDGK